MSVGGHIVMRSSRPPSSERGGQRGHPRVRRLDVRREGAPPLRTRPDRRRPGAHDPRPDRALDTPRCPRSAIAALFRGPYRKNAEAVVTSCRCRSGGTGRRRGLKIPFPQGSAGSSPASGTNQIRELERAREGKAKRKSRRCPSGCPSRGSLPELLVERTDRAPEMSGLQVRVPLGHHGSRVPEDVLHLVERDAVLHHPRRRGVSQRVVV